MQLEFIKDKVASEKMRRVIAMLSRSEGATNWDLNKVLFRYGSYINRLRNQGYKIETTCIKGGLYHYKITGKV